MGVVLTNILAQIPYYGTPLARQWGGEDVSETPLFDAYVAAVGNDRDNLLLWGHTGWFGGTPFIHRDSRVRAARITAPKQSEEPPTDLEGKAVRQLRASLKDNDTLGVLDAISRLGHIGTERTQMVLYEIAGNHLNRRRLEIMIKRGDDLAAYVRSMIGLHALQALVPSSGFRFAVRILKDIVLGSKGIAVFPEQEMGPGRFTCKAIVPKPDHPAVVREILEILDRGNDPDSEPSRFLLRDLLVKMDYKIREARIFHVAIDEAGILPLPQVINYTEDIYYSVIRHGMGNYFFSLVDKNRQTAPVAFNRSWEMLPPLEFKNDWPMFWVMSTVRENPEWAFHFIRMNNPSILSAVRGGLREALRSDRHFVKAIEAILSLKQADLAAQILMERYKELYGDSKAQGLIADAMEKTGDIWVVRHFEAERSVLGFWEIKRRRELTERIERTNKSKRKIEKMKV